MSDPEIVCKNTDCRVAENGKCIEGFNIEECPHIAPDSLAGDVSTSEAPQTEKSEDIFLPKSERLSVDDASSVLRSGETVVVTIVGPTDSGKTSLIASLCDLYQIGQVGAWQFAGARTLFAFEQACHDSRAASLRNIPRTEHTPFGTGLGFYHLALQNRDTQHVINLLMADRSGEEYRLVADDPSTAATFFEVHRANVINILVNGELLLDVGARHSTKHEVGMILQGFVDGGATFPNQRVAVVLTKVDTIERAPASDKARAERDFAGLTQEVQRAFSDSFSEIRAFKIAASPSEDDCPYGHGVEDLLMFWLTFESHLAVPDFVLPKGARAMSRFGTESAGK